MMRWVGEVQVYLHRAPIDMRLGRNGPAAIAQLVIQADPFEGGHPRAPSARHPQKEAGIRRQ
jgi:hypothetical protein